MGIAEKIGGIPALSAVFAVLTGLVGALSGKYLFTALRLPYSAEGWTARGFALGTAAHGIGAARALQVNADAGAYAGLALGLQVVLASLLMPLKLLAAGLMNHRVPIRQCSRPHTDAPRPRHAILAPRAATPPSSPMPAASFLLRLTWRTGFVPHLLGGMVRSLSCLRRFARDLASCLPTRGNYRIRRGARQGL